MQDFENSRYSQALGEEYSVDCSLDGAQCALLSGTPTPQASWLPARMTEPLRLSRSGMTCRPLTDDLGAALLTSRHVLVENSPLLVRRGLARVLGDLAAMGYDARWGIIGAADVGAPHQRDRIWIVASDARHMCGGHGSESAEQEEPATARRSDDATDADGQPLRDTTGEDLESKVSKRTVAWLHGSNRQLADAAVEGLEGQRSDARESTITKSWNDGASVADANGDRTHGASGSETKRTWPSDEGWWSVEPDVGRVAHGVAHRVDRLRCTGNGQVPRVAALAWRSI